MLDKVEDALEAMSIKYDRLDGTMKREDRSRKLAARTERGATKILASSCVKAAQTRERRCVAHPHALCLTWCDCSGCERQNPYVRCKSLASIPYLGRAHMGGLALNVVDCFPAIDTFWPAGVGVAPRAGDAAVQGR